MTLRFHPTRVALLCWFALGSAACGSEGQATGSTCPSDSTLTYDSFGQAFIATNCLRCHSASGPESPKLDTVEQIRAHSGEIDKAAAAGPDAVNTSMPEDTNISDDERRRLGEWLACGAP